MVTLCTYDRAHLAANCCASLGWWSRGSLQLRERRGWTRRRGGGKKEEAEQRVVLELLIEISVKVHGHVMVVSIHDRHVLDRGG